MWAVEVRHRLEMFEVPNCSLSNVSLEPRSISGLYSQPLTTVAIICFSLNSFLVIVVNVFNFANVTVLDFADCPKYEGFCFRSRHQNQFDSAYVLHNVHVFKHYVLSLFCFVFKKNFNNNMV